MSNMANFLLQSAMGLGLVLQATTGAARTLDDFEDHSAWSVSSTDQVEAILTVQPHGSGKAACVAYNFGNVSGYLALSRKLPLEFNGNFRINVDVRGQGAVNALELKLVDGSGNNVWWHRHADFVPSAQWTTLATKRRQVEFAWGPATDKNLRATEQVEFVVVGAQGTKGEMCFDNLRMETLPEPPAQWPSPVWTREDLKSPGVQVGAMSAASPWRYGPESAAQPTILQTDFGQAREISGLVLHWLPAMHAVRYHVDASLDGVEWRTIQHVAAGMGGREVLHLPEQELRYVRLVFERAANTQLGLEGVDFLDIGALPTPNAFVSKQASLVTRGWFPRGFSGEQSYWTLLGIPGGSEQALMSEDGAVESHKRGPSVEPFVEVNGRLMGWADVQVAQSLDKGYLPMPHVVWTHPKFQLRTSAFASDEGALQSQVRYRLSNPTNRRQRMVLWLALRPFQVNPPTQFLNIAGGVAPMQGVRWDGRGLSQQDGQVLLIATESPTEVRFGQGGAGSLKALQDGSAAQGATQWSDPQGFASAALKYELDLPAHGSKDIVIVLPQGATPMLPGNDAVPAQWFDTRWAQTAGKWTAWLNRTTVALPGDHAGLAETMRTALAHILINKQGPVIRPGTRSYARSWIRDGAMTGTVLSRLGYAQLAQDYADWFTPKLFANGKVPCCIDARGADPVPENDSMGAYLHLIADTYRYNGDLAWLQGKWPAASKVLGYMDLLRGQEGPQKNGTPDRSLYLGLLPPSISHEGYSDQAAYSYWDDFWGVLGYADGTEMARALGDKQAEAHWGQQHAAFTHDVLASLQAAQAKYQRNVVFGAADRGDVDPTSTTVALAPGGLQGVLPAQALKATFAQYWKNFVQRRDTDRTWDAYTPYEWRNVGALVRLGEREQALAVSEFLLRDRRPLGWKQWAEVVTREPRQPRYLGDMPHGWVSSDFLRATLDMFAYEAPQYQAWVLGGGVDPAWLRKQGLALRNLHTPLGLLSYSARQVGAKTTVEIAAGMRLPQGGLVLALPGATAATSVTVNGQAQACLQPAGIGVHRLPATVQFVRSPKAKQLPFCPS